MATGGSDLEDQLVTEILQNLADRGVVASADSLPTAR